MSFPNDPVGGSMFTIVPVLMVLFFIAFFGIIIYSIVKSVGRWSYNNTQPVLTVPSKIVAKRTDVSSSSMMHDDSMHHNSTSTSYYVTFEVESGDRMEFLIQDKEYGMLAEEDAGKLTFQGSRYLGFKRDLVL